MYNKADRETVTTRIHPEVEAAARIQAITENVSFPDLLERLLVAYLATVKTNKQPAKV